MKFFVVSLFTTIVLAGNLSAKSQKGLGSQLDLDSKSTSPTIQAPPGSYEFDLSPMKRPKPSKEAEKKPAFTSSYYSISSHLGISYTSDRSPFYNLGFQYFDFKTKMPLEYGFDLFDRGSALLSLGKKWFRYDLIKYQFHFKVGLGLFLQPDQGIATILDIDNIGPSIQVGIEKSLSPPLSIRLDFDSFIASNIKIYRLQFGYSWSW